MRRLIVSKKYRRKGWGAKLVSRLELECLKMGYSKIMLETSELQLAAIALYRSLGYKMQDPVVCDTEAHKGVSGIARYRLVTTLV
jgi:GNAT superfamily N-acetyltransferase